MNYVSPDTAEIERLHRIQTYIASMGMSVGFLWNQWNVEARSAIMETTNGAPGLHDYIVEWATEFDAMWEEREAIIKSKDLPDGDDFPDQLAAFIDAKIKTLMAVARLS